MQLPSPRGELSSAVASTLLGRPSRIGAITPPDDVLGDDDLQLALWMLYELHYRGFEDVDEDREWEPSILDLRARIEEVFLAALRGETQRAVAALGDDPTLPVSERIAALAKAWPDPGLSRHLQRQATREQFLELLALRSVYHLKESDPHSFVLPRLEGTVKVRLAELQYDEYGAGRPDRLHAALFARGMESVGLDATYGAHVGQAAGATLAVSNAMTLFALHRRLRGAAMGQLAAFETTSSLPCRRIAQGARRLELPEEVAAYYEEHVEADAVHEQMALREICDELARQDPRLTEDIVFGAATDLLLSEREGARVLACWNSGNTELRQAEVLV